MVSLRIPWSWEKLQLSRKLRWIGWVFDLCARSASAPADKVNKAAAKVRLLFIEGRKIERHDVDKLIGLLLWWTNGAVWLCPWLQGLYRLLFKPRVVCRSVNLAQFGELSQSLSTRLVVLQSLTSCDILADWKLHSVNNVDISDAEAPTLQFPRVRNGCVSLVFFDYHSFCVTVNQTACFAACLFHRAICDFTQVPLALAAPSADFCAADAFARRKTGRGWHRWLLVAS